MAIPLVAGALAVGALAGAWGWWRMSAPRVSVEGLRSGATLQRAKLGEQLTIVIRPRARTTGTEVRLDGDALVPQPTKPGVLTVALPTMDDGPHELMVRVRRWGYGDIVRRWKFVLDDTAPTLTVPPEVAPVPIDQPYTLEGSAEAGSTVTVPGADVRHDGDSVKVAFARPPAAPVTVTATDVAGNVSTAVVVVPVVYPGTHAVHVSSAAWGTERYRNSINALIDAKRIDAVELDIKDESGVVGYNSTVDLAHQIGAVRADYDLPQAVRDLHAKGVRVIGRIVAFRDPILAKAAWANDHKDWVLQTPAGQPLGAYGGFTNFANSYVRQYNIALAEEAAKAGVNDILWDYVRRPEGALASMKIPGLSASTTEAVAASVADFLAEGHAALRLHGVYQGASVFGIAATRPEQIGQDVALIAQHVDYIAPMVYPGLWNNGEYGIKSPERDPGKIVKLALADFQKDMKKVNAVKPLVPWLQDFSLNVPYGIAEVQAQITAGNSLGVQDWLLWNANVKYSLTP